VYGFELGGEWIGTIRIVPLGFGLTLTETLMPQAGADVPAPGAHDWEVGRLVLSPEYRADVDALRHCLRIALEDAGRASRVDHLYATCTHVLGRLYRRFGFAVVAKEVPLAGTPKVYTLIRGPFQAVARGLSTKPVAVTQ
jgi:predicted GNAT family N-acyltransferase